MAGKYEDLLKLAKAQEERTSPPMVPAQNPTQNLLQTLASIAMRTGNPNTERGQIFNDAGGAYMGAINQRNASSFMNEVSQIAKAPIDPGQKIALLVSLKAQHGQDYGLGLDDIVKQYTSLRGQDVTMRGQDINANKGGAKKWEPGSMEEAIALERAKAGIKTEAAANKPKSAAEQKSELELEDRKRRMEFARQDVLDVADDTLKTIQEVEAGIKNFGVFGNVPSIPGTSRAKWEANVNKLLSSNIINLMTTMKSASKTGATGFGALNKEELTVLRNASTALKRGLSPEDAAPILADMRAKVMKIAGRQAQGGGGSTAPAGGGAPAGGRVAVVGPNGQRGTVPADQLEDALAQGYKRG